MEKRDKIFIGALLVFVGAIILIGKLFPEARAFGRSMSFFTVLTLTVGLAMMVSGFIGKHNRVVLGAVLTGISGILIYQNAANGFINWQPWLLLPTFLGSGLMMRDMLDGATFRKAWKDSAILIVMGIVLFALFFFKGFITVIVPILLVIAGAALLFGQRKRSY